MLSAFRAIVCHTFSIVIAYAALHGASGFAPSVAQDQAAPTVALPMQRSEGERFFIETSQIKETLSGEIVLNSTRQNSLVVATVESVDQDGYVLDVNTRTFEISGQDGLPDELVDSLIAMQVQMPVKIQMTAEGTVAGLANGPEVVAFATGAMSEVGSYVESLDMPFAARAMMAQVMSPLFDPAYIERSLLRSPRLYFFMSGAELETDTTYDIDDSIVFPLFSRPLPSRIYFGISAVDHSARTVTYDWRQEPDQDVFRSEMKTFLRRVAAQSGARQPSTAELDRSSFTYTAEASLVYGLDSGLPLSMVFVKAIDIQGQR